MFTLKLTVGKCLLWSTWWARWPCLLTSFRKWEDWLVTGQSKLFDLSSVLINTFTKFSNVTLIPILTSEGKEKMCNSFSCYEKLCYILWLDMYLLIGTCLRGKYDWKSEKCCCCCCVDFLIICRTLSLESVCGLNCLVISSDVTFAGKPFLILLSASFDQPP